MLPCPRHGPADIAPRPNLCSNFCRKHHSPAGHLRAFRELPSSRVQDKPSLSETNGAVEDIGGVFKLPILARLSHSRCEPVTNSELTNSRLRRAQTECELAVVSADPWAGCVNRQIEINTSLSTKHKAKAWSARRSKSSSARRWNGWNWFNNRRLLEPIGNIPPPKPSNATTPCWNNQPWRVT